MEQSAFDNHPLWATLTELESLVQDAAQTAGDAAVAGLAQLRFLVAALKKHRTPVDSLPYANATLTAIHGPLSNTTQYVKHYKDSGNIAHLNQAVEYSDGVQHLLGNLPPAVRSEVAANASRTFIEYRSIANATISELRSSNEALRADLADLEQKRVGDQESAKAEAAAINDRLAKLDQKIAQDESRLDAALTENNENFNNGQTGRETRFSKWLDEQGSALASLAAKDIDEIGELRLKGENELAAISDLRDSTESVASLATGDVLARHYGNYSERQWRWGIYANLAGFIAVLSGVALLVWSVRDIGPDESVSWQFTAMKLGLTLTVVGGAAVAFKVGGNFLAQSHKSKDMELELRSIGPFLADVEGAAAQEAKTGFVTRRFGQSTAGETNGPKDAVSIAALDQITTLMEKLKSGTP